jgi:hypothetical protein
MNLTKRIRYSPHPPEQYVRTVNTIQVGPGTLAHLAGNLAAWNLYWLSCPGLETFTELQPTHAVSWGMDPVIPEAVRTAHEWAGNIRVADLVVHLPPRLFIAEMRRRPHKSLALARHFSRLDWMEVMECRARLYIEQPDLAYPRGYLLH